MMLRPNTFGWKALKKLFFCPSDALQFEHIHDLMNSFSCLSNFIGIVLQQRAKTITLDELLMCNVLFTSVRLLTFQF